MNEKHGHTKAGKHSRTYNSWRNLRRRCDDPNNPDYKHYGGRGIKYDPRWDFFENFLADMGERPDGMTLDRIDNDGHYVVHNCQWATPAEQRKNQR